MANQTQITLGKEAMEAIRNTAQAYADRGEQYGSFAERFKGAEVKLGDQYLEQDAPAGVFGTASDVASRLAIASAREDERLMDLTEQKAEERVKQSTTPVDTQTPFNEEEAPPPQPSGQDQKTADVISSIRANVYAPLPMTREMRKSLSQVETQQARAEWRTRGTFRAIGQMLAEPFGPRTPDSTFMRAQVSAYQKDQSPPSRSDSLFRANQLLAKQTVRKSVPNRSADLANAYKMLAEQEAAKKAKRLIAKK